MNVVDSYLDTLFAPYPSSNSMWRARQELRDMMEDKFQDLQEKGLPEAQAVGQVIAEFGSLDELAPVLGIEAEIQGSVNNGKQDMQTQLDPEQARRYVDATRVSTVVLGISIGLFILSPVPLLILVATFIDSGNVGGSVPAPIIGAGVFALFVMVAMGIMFQVRRNAILEDFENITSGDFERSTHTDDVAYETWDGNRSQAIKGRMVAIGLLVLCPVPVILLAILDRENYSLVIVGFIITLCMAALGVMVMLFTRWSESAANDLLQDGDDDESVHPVIRIIASVYWPVVLIVFLLWSFIGDGWARSWLTWPIAVALYGGMWALSDAIAANRGAGDGTSRAHS